MIAKLIAWGEDREIAARRLAEALSRTELAGPVTNASFLVALLRHPAFLSGDVDTGFIDRHRSDLLRREGFVSDRALAIAAMAIVLHDNDAARAGGRANADPHSPWLACDGWRLNGTGGSSVLLRASDKRRDVRLTFARRDWIAEIDGGPARLFASPALSGTRFQAATDEGLIRARAILVGERITILEDGEVWRLEREDVLARAEASATGHERVVSPMPGTIIRVLVEEGARVTARQSLIVVEAMKMEHAIAAPGDGKIGRIHYRAGDTVAEGAELMEFEAAS
jgi:3-methylcrotonyl-CoA carboxylase alpha subunit